MRKNILFFILVLVLSLATAPYFGTWYDTISPQYGGWVTSKSDAVSFAGFFVAYIFLIPFTLELFGNENRKKWILWSLLLPALLWIGADIEHIYLPIILGLIAFVLAKLVRLLISKIHRPNPPMVIK